MQARPAGAQASSTAHPGGLLELRTGIWIHPTEMSKMMKSARAMAVLTWIYTAAFGVPAIPVSVYLLQSGELPTMLGLFTMYGGPWDVVEDGTFVALLIAFLAVTMIAAWAAWLVWHGSRVGAGLAMALLPVEAVFWFGFALPFPWLIGVARATLLVLAWKSLHRR